MGESLKKLYICINGNKERGGYINIDPFGVYADRRNVACLDDYADDAELDELIVDDVIDYLPANEMNDIVDHWIRKIRHGGKITITGTDIREVCRAIVEQRLELSEANFLLYGYQRTGWEYKKSTITLQKLIEVFESRGFKIVLKKIVAYNYSVTAERP